MILPISLVKITGSNPNITRDLDNFDKVYIPECGVFIDVVSSVEIDRADLLVLAQTDCLSVGHVVSVEEDELYDLGRNTGADLVGYYVSGDTAGFAGCAAHPAGRRGFWVGDGASPWTFGHEVGHVVGDNGHVGDDDNLMFTPTASIQNLPPDLDDDQVARILDDPALLSVSSIVLNL